MKKQKKVYIVHCVDVEGPMTETLDATFERIYAYDIPKNIKATTKNLKLIQDGKLSGISNDLSQTLKRVFNKHSLGYLGNWEEIDKAILKITSEKFRKKYSSKNGSPYKFSWFIYDHHDDFTNNPRLHDVGVHHIHDHYMDLLLKENSANDGIYWHYHHPAVNGDALTSNVCWSNMTTHESIISRRIIERNWYFSVFRAGMLIERNDLSHWLEMFVPFDYTARFAPKNEYDPFIDFDWRGCPNKWGGWNPDWYDYRIEGDMKRYLFQCTELWTYLSILSEEKVNEAFSQAEENGSSILSYYNHDYRNMEFEIDNGYSVITKVAEKYPDIDWEFISALDAARLNLEIQEDKPELKLKIIDNILYAKNNGAPIFGPQPFLAIKENGLFFRDNFNKDSDFEWTYKIQNIKNIQAIGVAANSRSGNYDLKVIEI